MHWKLNFKPWQYVFGSLKKVCDAVVRFIARWTKKNYTCSFNPILSRKAVTGIEASSGGIDLRFVFQITIAVGRMGPQRRGQINT